MSEKNDEPGPLVPEDKINEILDKIDFTKANDMVATIAVDKDNKDVLMVAWANRAAIEKTLRTGWAYYHSRSRNKQWRKGEESGHTQRVVELKLDCDFDAVMYVVDQKVAACHTGYRSCFFTKVDNKGELVTIGEKAFDPDAVYKK